MFGFINLSANPVSVQVGEDSIDNSGRELESGPEFSVFGEKIFTGEVVELTEEFLDMASHEQSEAFVEISSDEVRSLLTSRWNGISAAVSAGWLTDRVFLRVSGTEIEDFTKINTFYKLY